MKFDIKGYTYGYGAVKGIYKSERAARSEPGSAHGDGDQPGLSGFFREAEDVLLHRDIL